MVKRKQTQSTKLRQKSPHAASIALKEKIFETDGTYLLKLAVVAILGTVWLKFATPIVWLGIPFGAFPVGLAVGLILVRLFEGHQSDRKIWYMVLIIVALITYGADKGVVI